MKTCFSFSRRTKPIYSAENVVVGSGDVQFSLSSAAEAVRLRGRLRMEESARCVKFELQRGEERSAGSPGSRNDAILDVNQRQTSLEAKAGDISVRMEYSPFLLTVYDCNTCVCVCKLFKEKAKLSLLTEIKGVKHVYGLAERASRSRLINGHSYTLYNTDEFGLAHGTDKPLYGSIPFILGVRDKDFGGVGLLLLNESKIVVRVEHRKWSPSSRQYWWHEDGNVDLVFFLHKDAIRIRQSFMAFIGITPLPPLFSLGYHQCRWNYNDQEDVLKVDSSLLEAGIPCDVIWLDIEHTDNKRYLTWDTSKFNPSELINTLKKNGRHLVVIVDPHLKADSNYSIYQEADDAGYLIKNEHGSTFIGKCWSDDSSWVDFINKDASAWWSDKICAYLKEYGCSSEYNNLWIWNDMNEPSVFNCPDNQMKPTAIHVHGLQHKQVHNVYGHKMVQATWSGIMKACGGNLRPFLLSRSFYTGSQKYGAIWTGDSLCNWDHLQVSISMMLSLSICGIDFCGADVGGFFGDPEPELLCRWYQFGAFQPFFRAHAHIDSHRREPYLPEEPYKTAIKNAICLRYKLLSYWYLCFWNAEKLLLPVVSSLWMNFPEHHLKDNDEAYMVGNSMLIRPIVTNLCHSLNIVLPGASNDIWYQYCNVSKCWKARKVGQKLKISVNIDSIPVFYKGGSCIFMKEGNYANTNEWRREPYCIVLFPSNTGSSTGLLYLDDYTSYEYKNKEEYGVYRCTFSLKDSSICMESENKNQYKLFASCTKISMIKIIRINEFTSARWEHVFLNKSDTEEDYIITHFDDRIEISNISVNVSNSWSMTMT